MNMVRESREENPCYEIGASSILGGRKYQQDYGYYYTDNSQILGIVCDGMGGLQGGERASQTAVETMVREFFQAKDIVSAPDFLLQAAERMNRAVLDLKDDRGKGLDAGTTLVASYFTENKMYWVSVGDSRIWLLRGEKLQAITREHNYEAVLNMQLEQGMIDADFYEKEMSSARVDALTSFLGMERIKYVDVNKKPIELQPGDIVALCSDGVYKSLTDSQVYALIRDTDIDMEIAADCVTEMALRYGGRKQDNTTIILIKYLGNEGDPE